MPSDMDGARVDVILARLLPELSRSQTSRLADDGYIRHQGRPLKPGQRLKAGDTLEVELPESQPTGLVAQSIPLKVVHRDPAILVVDKAAGMVVHPGHGHADGTLVNALLALDPELRVGMAHRPGLVHRLDQGTSGLMVIARSDAALRNLQAQWAARETLKVYQALVVGVPSPDRATIEAPIGRDPRHRQRMAVVGDGRPATTEYKLVEQIGGLSLVETRIHTGRTHQIRVHFASIGHPVVGDETYGAAAPELKRQFLHASRLGFHHPDTGVWVEYEAPLPPELSGYLERLRRLNRRG